MPARKKATKRKNPSRSRRNAPSGAAAWSSYLSARFRSRRALFIIGLLLLLFFCFITVAVISYFFTAAHDQSIVREVTFGQAMQGIEQQVSNVCNLQGAYLASRFVDGFLGIGVVFLLYFFMRVALSAMGVMRGLRWSRDFLFSGIAALWTSVVAAAISPAFAGVLPFRLGGAHGQYLASELIFHTGYVGLVLILLFTLILTIVLYDARAVQVFQRIFSLSWIKLGKRYKEQGEFSLPEDESLVSESPMGEEDGGKVEPTEPTPPYTEDKEDEEIELTDDAKEEDHAIYIPLGPKSRQDISDCSVAPKAPDPQQVGAQTTPSGLVVEVSVGDELSQPVEQEQISQSRAEFQFPSLELLTPPQGDNEQVDMSDIRSTEQQIIDTLNSFKIKARPTRATIGPTVTLYEIEPDAGVKISRIRNLEDDMALSLKAKGGIRIIAPIPGKGTIGIEVPNRRPQTVAMRSLLVSRRFVENDMELPIAMGKTITNEVFMFDLTKMPHLLIAGATGQGKSVGLNVMITSLLYSKKPEELKFVMIDPKMLEFSIYAPLEEHYFARVPGNDKCIITDMQQVVPTLLSLCEEMDRRYQLLAAAKVRNIGEYNRMVEAKETNLGAMPPAKLPYIVVIVDEFADLIMTSGKEVERPITRIAQKARAAGIHMVLATQRPTTDILTGTIKANFPARIAFKVFAAVDSRTILDQPGANQLIGRGDMLYYQGKEMVRLQCAFIDTPETDKVVRYIAAQPATGPQLVLPKPPVEESSVDVSASLGSRDELFEEVAHMIVETQNGSTSAIQRKYEMGYNRAGRLTDQLEAAGILGPQRGSKPREVLVSDIYHLRQILNQLDQQ